MPARTYAGVFSPTYLDATYAVIDPANVRLSCIRQISHGRNLELFYWLDKSHITFATDNTYSCIRLK